MKVLLVGLVAVVPGGLLFLLAYALTRALVDAWHRASTQTTGGHIQLRSVLSQIRFRDTLRQVRTSFG